jgi:hypothetical protein
MPPDYEALHTQLARILLDRIQTGEATAADLNVARQFLKDNGVRVAGEGKSDTFDSLAEALPFPAPEDIREQAQ